MGCWNGTCAITNLPVMAGDKVYCLFLVESPYKGVDGDHCYCDTYYTPFPLFFEGEYDDYGGVEKCSPESQYIVDFLKENIVEMEQGENKYHDVPVKVDDLDIYKVLEADHEGRLYVKNGKYGKDELRFTHIIIKKNVLDSLLESVGLSYNPKKENGDEDYYTTLKAYYKDFESDFENVRQAIIKISEDDSMSRFMLLAGLTSLSISLKQTGYKMPDYWDIFRGMDIRYGYKHAQQVILKEAKDKDKHNHFLKCYIVMTVLNYYMGRSRKVWIKPSGEGSQDSNTNMQEITAKLITDAAVEINQRWVEDN
jgi:hypothetical protein